VPVTNQLSRISIERKINEDSIGFFSEKNPHWEEFKAVNFNKNPVINEKSKDFLYKISTILTKHKTKYKIVISPIYGGQQVHSIDLKFLNSIFTNVYDFTGPNRLTTSYGLYYDNIHPRRIAGQLILRDIYNKK
jgi:hypothetical protein